MARPLRIEFMGAFYHVTSRGDGQEDIVLDDGDRVNFLDVLGAICRRYNWRLHAYCLMGNHYHLLVETPEGNLAKGMRQLNGIYTQRFNRRHQRVGHVFQGRYKAILVQKDEYLLELARYIVINPVMAGMVRSVKDWPWSSYRGTVGQALTPAWLFRDEILSAFGKRRDTAIVRYREFVAQGKTQPTPWVNLKHQIYLGTTAFIDDMQSKILIKGDLSEIPAAQRQPVPKSLDEYSKKYPNRNEAIAMAYESGGYSLKDIGAYFDLHYSRISRIVAQHAMAKSKT